VKIPSRPSFPVFNQAEMTDSDSITALLTKLRSAAEAAGFTVETFGQTAHYPLLGMTRTADSANEASRHLYLSAGIHGDEPAGPQALLELLEEDALPRAHHDYLCPLLNPDGLAAGTRENAEGIDLNRDYRDFATAEVRAHADWLQAKVTRLDCALHLHEDWESRGFYLYELNFGAQPGYAERILQATRRFLPTESAAEIDGRAARDGVIRPDRIPEIEEGDPEAIYIHKKYGGLNYTLETPSTQDLRHRVGALKAAVAALF